MQILQKIETSYQQNKPFVAYRKPSSESVFAFFQNDNYLRNIVVKQLNFLPKDLYLYFFNLNFIQKIFKNQSFKTELFEVNNTYSCSFKNFEKLNIKNIKYTNILFTKES